MKTQFNFRTSFMHVHVMRYLLPLVVFLLPFVSFGQNNEKAKKEYEKALVAVEKQSYTKALELYMSAITTEMGDGNPDYLFTGRLLEDLAKWYSSPDYFSYASQYYLYAAIQHNLAGEFEKVKTNLYNASLLRDSILKHDEKIEHNIENGSYLTFDFSVDSVIGVSGDTTWFFVKAGSNQNLTKGQLGWILTKHENGSDRGNEVYGQCGLMEIYHTRSKAWAVISEEAKKLGLSMIPGDNVQVKVKISPEVYQGIIFKMAKLNIYFVDDYRQSFYDFDLIQNITKSSSEDAIISAMRQVIHGTAAYLYDSNDYNKEDYPNLVGGIFRGQNMWEAMLNCTNDDIRIFLRYVNSYPAKYMGRDFRIDETFATWVINETPFAAEETEELTKEFLNFKDLDSMSLWIKEHHAQVVQGVLSYEEINNHIYALINDSNYQKAEGMIEMMISLTDELKLDSLHQVFSNANGQNLAQQKKYEEAIEVYTQVLRHNPDNANSHWFRGLAYLSNEEYKRALSDYEYLMDSFPNWAGGHGMYGWTHLKMGDFPTALQHCEKAHFLDSFNASYSMNLGHAYLLTGSPEKARPFYVNSLENMEAASDFQEGVIADLDFFAKRMWQPELVKREKVFLLNEWESHYQYRILANEYFEKGKKLEKKEEYALAGVSFDKAIEFEQNSKDVRYDWLRSYNRWSAFQYYKNKDFEKSLARYQKGWDINRSHLGNLQEEIEDLESIGNLYSWLDNDVQKDMYRKMQYAAQRKLQTTTRSNSLYVISIGYNNYGNVGYSYAENDATQIAKVIQQKAQLVFDKSDIKIFNSENAQIDSIKTAFEKVIINSRPGDCFIMYYSGYCKRDEHSFMVFGDDTLTNPQLLGWLNLMQADKKMILMDAANTSLIKEYASHEEKADALFENENLTFILSDGRVEMPNDKTGLFTSHLINGIRGEAAVNWGSRFQLESDQQTSSLAYITAKGLEGYMYGKMNKGNMLFELKSYSYGADFPISFQSSVVSTDADKEPPMIYISGAVSGAGTRGSGSKTVTSKEIIYGQALDASGISEVWANGKSIAFTQNGKFKIFKKHIGTASKLVVKAKDNKGIWAIDSFIVKGEDKGNAPSKGPGQENKTGTNYAILFATNTYDNWSDLNNPLNDVRAIGDILEREYGFKVEIIEDKTRAEVRNKLLDYFAKDYTSKDQLFVFFAGHGIHHPYLGGQIVLKDSKRSSDDPTFDTYLSFEWVKSNLNNVYRCPHIMLSLDVCYGGAGFNERKAPYYGSSISDIAADPQGYFNKTLAYKTRLYLTSGDSTYVSDGQGTHSPFAEKIILTLNEKGAQKGGVVTLTDFANNMRYTEGGRQQIRYGSFGDSHMDGDFVFLHQGGKISQNESNDEAGGGWD